MVLIYSRFRLMSDLINFNRVFTENKWNRRTRRYRVRMRMQSA